MYLDAFENQTAANLNINRRLLKGTITSDGIIDDDFETELGGNESTVRKLKLFCFLLTNLSYI